MQDPSRFSGLRFTISGNFRPGIKLHIMYHSALIKTLPEASHEWEIFVEFMERDHVIDGRNASNHFSTATSFLPPTSIGLCLGSFNRRSVPPTESCYISAEWCSEIGEITHLAPMCLMCQAVKRGSASIYYALFCRPFLL